MLSRSSKFQIIFIFIVIFEVCLFNIIRLIAMKSNSKKTAAHHHESQSNQNKKNRSRDWLES